MNWFIFLVTLGAIARFARLIAEDTITEPLRERVKNQFLYDLVTCVWCVSVWLSVPLSFIGVFWGTNRVIFAIFLALTGSLVAGWLVQHEPDD